MMKLNQWYKGILVLMICVPVFVACDKAQVKLSGNVSADIAIIPGAHIVVRSDYAAIHASTFNKRVQEIFEKNVPFPGMDTDQSLDELTELIEQTLGLQTTDIQTITASAKLQGVSFDALSDNFAEYVEAVIAFELKKAITLDQVQNFFTAMAQKAEMPANISIHPVAGIDCLVVSNDMVDETVYFSLPGNGKVLLGGTLESISNALHRADKPVSLDAALAETGIPVRTRPATLISFILSDEMRSALNEELADATDDLEKRVADSVKNMRALSLGLTLDDSADITLYVNLASAEQAGTLRNLADNMLLPMIRLGSSMFTKGKSLPVLDTLKTETSGTVASINLKISIIDIETVNELLEDLDGLF